CGLRRKVATHPVYANAGRRGCRADVQPLARRAVPAERGANEHLAQIHDAHRDVAADEVGIAPLEVRGRDDVARQYAIAEAGSEALDLPFDGGEHVDSGSSRHVTVAPRGVTSRGRARRIEQRMLREEDERPLVGASPRDVAL